MDLEIRKYINILEAQEKAYQVNLSYKRDELSPVLSKEALDLHYGKLHKNYVEKATKGIDTEFNLAGAELHNLYFGQLCPPQTSNKPHGASLELIEKEWKNYDDFRETFKEHAQNIQGSGWCYLSKSGTIQTIQTHKRRTGVALIIDMWEHAWLLDYGQKKEKYIDNFWKIIDWNIVNARIES